jgi:protease-4
MKAFFKFVGGIVLAVFLIFALAGIVLSSMMEEEPQIPEKGFLLISLSGPLPDFVNSSPMESMFGGEPVSVYGIYESLYKAAEDERVAGVVFKSVGSFASTAALDEVADAVKSFKEKSGKPVYFFSDMLFNKDLYLAASCDSAWLLPEAVVVINGLSAKSSYYRDGLAKLGIEADFIPIGLYKNAPEAFTRSNMSEDQKEVINDLLDFVWPHILKKFAGKAGKTTAEVEKDIETGLFDANTLAEKGYIDGLLYRDQLIKKMGEADKFISYSEYREVSRKSLGLYKGNKIALIFATGSVLTGTSGEDPVFGHSMGSASVTEDIRKAVKDKKVKAIVFRIDSPGGMVNASDIIWRELKKAGEKKPVIISVGSICASGGYYIAMGGDSIIAHQGSIVGSIGVFAGKFVYKDLMNEKLGIHNDGINRGAFAEIFSPWKPFSAKERLVMRRNMTEFYHRFVGKVAMKRGLSYEETDKVAQGRIWIGEKNISTGLVDSFGNLTDAMKAALQKAGLDPAKPYRWKLYPRPKDFLTELQQKAMVYIQSPWERIFDRLAFWVDKPFVFSLYPYNITIE